MKIYLVDLDSDKDKEGSSVLYCFFHKPKMDGAYLKSVCPHRFIEVNI